MKEMKYPFRLAGMAMIKLGHLLLDVWVKEDVREKCELRDMIAQVMRDNRGTFCTCSRQFEPSVNEKGEALTCSCQNNKRGWCCCHQINDMPIGKG